jgi:uncharacterized membrane protein YfcA
MQIALCLALGLGVGVVSGLLGVGGGALMVPIFIYFFKMDVHKAIGTSLAVIIFIALVGSVKHFMSGNIEIKTLGFFIAAALVGGWLGASLANVIPAVVLKRMFAILMVGVAIHMFWKS